MTEEKRSVYIQSLQAADIYNSIIRGEQLKHKYVGMVPVSRELDKLQLQKLNIKTVKSSGKQTTNDLINIKFDKAVLSGNKIISNINKAINNTKDQDKIKSYTETIVAIRSEIEAQLTKWNRVSCDGLRDYLYDNGFEITYIVTPQKVDKETGEILREEETETINYVVYKRSSSKSRVGNCLFIREELYNEMINWSRMELDIPDNVEFDYPGLLAYESLIASAAEDEIEISPDNILIVNDVESVFKEEVSVIKKDQNSRLDSFPEEAEIKNCLFDGSSLLDSKYFSNGKGFALLRNHMMKSAAFNTELQQYLRDNCPEDQDYDTWELLNMFDQPILAKDVHMVLTPSSLKALKFSNFVESTGSNEDISKNMWEHWKERVRKDNNIFGICKFEHHSKRGYDENGNILQQTSYQMLNSIQMEAEDIIELAQYEKDYLEQLKNNDDAFLDYAIDNANEINSNQMWYNLVKHNQKIINTEQFRDFRSQQVLKHKKHIMKGKLRLNGDYCVMVGNPLEYLQHAIGELPLTNGVLNNGYDGLLRGNQVYTTLHDFDKEYVTFRNPHTSPANILIVKNTDIPDIKKYFNFTDNIIAVNAVKFPIMDTLSGCDWDSDTCVVFKNDRLISLAMALADKYRVCVNGIKSKNALYTLNNQNKAKIDNILAKSQDNIGTCVNLGQLLMSTYWHLLHQGKKEAELEELYKKIEIVTVLSGIAIDQAKRSYDIDLKKEIEHIADYLRQFNSKHGLRKDITTNKGTRKVDTVPNFWQFVSEDKNVDKKIQLYDCPMDYLFQEFIETDKANGHLNIPFRYLMTKLNKKDRWTADRGRKAEVITVISEMDQQISQAWAEFNKLKKKNEYDERERDRTIDNAIRECIAKLKRWKKIKRNTMYIIVEELFKSDISISRAFDVLYKTHQEMFLEVFKKNNVRQITSVIAGHKYIGKDKFPRKIGTSIDIAS